MSCNSMQGKGKGRLTPKQKGSDEMWMDLDRKDARGAEAEG